jgi:hypothetical protein
MHLFDKRYLRRQEFVEGTDDAAGRQIALAVVIATDA